MTATEWPRISGFPEIENRFNMTILPYPPTEPQRNKVHRVFGCFFPGTDVLREETKAVAQVHAEGEDFDRVTLTAPAINQAAVVAFLVSGISKAPVLRDVIEGPGDPNRLPAQLIRPFDGELLWLIDREAASRLNGTE